MNKMIKGSVAGATGIVLLMGGFGTYALWNDSTTANSAPLTAGHLRIADDNANGTWYYQDGTTLTPITDPNFLMVPGDTVVLKQPLAVEASGTHLKAVLEVSGIENTFEDLAVKLDYATVNDTFFGDWAASAAHGLNYDSTLIDELNGATEAVVTFSLPSEPTNGTDGTALSDPTTTQENQDQDASINLSNVTVTLRQVL